MNKTYSVYWTQTALDELSGILAYPPYVKERIYLDSFARLIYTPTLTAKQIDKGKLKDLWARLGLYQNILVFIGIDRGLSTEKSLPVFKGDLSFSLGLPFFAVYRMVTGTMFEFPKTGPSSFDPLAGRKLGCAASEP
jgi:hypothetical protein